jgi:hypothetical protein
MVLTRPGKAKKTFGSSSKTFGSSCTFSQLLGQQIAFG